MDILTITEASKLWRIGKTRIRKLIAAGGIPGAVRVGPNWTIPRDTIAPARTPKGWPKGRTRKALVGGDAPRHVPKGRKKGGSGPVEPPATPVRAKGRKR